MSELNDRLRALPPVDRVIALLPDVPHHLAVSVARRALDEARRLVGEGGGAPAIGDVVATARGLLDAGRRRGLIPVINATGVLIHTNLGRVPLGSEQLDAVAEVARGYSNLEYEIDEGRRGHRYVHARELLRELTGAEDALVVNNCAAAVLLVLAGLCSGREVLISRGELIEIGGEFRIPEVMAASGARLVEVGTTNRTHLSDYERAIGPDSGAILKVHPSNYRVVGYTAEVPGRDLARLARGRGLVFVHDLGSGLVGEGPWGSRDEPLVGGALAGGADLVTFSGDKLLGGPQAGVIAGRAGLVARLSKHPLLRALRVDKMTLAALQATLTLHLEGRTDAIPLWGMAARSPAELEGRAAAVAEAVTDRIPPGAKVEAVQSRALPGGGSMPGAELGSWALALQHPERGADELAGVLRRRATPVIGRIEDHLVLLDLRAVPPEADQELAEAVVQALT